MISPCMYFYALPIRTSVTAMLVGLEWNPGNPGMKLYFDCFMLFNTYYVPTSRVHFHKCTFTPFQGRTSMHFQGCTSMHFQGRTSTQFQQRTFTHSQQSTSGNALLCTPTSFKYSHPHFYALLRTFISALPRTCMNALLRTSNSALLCTPTSFTYLHPHFYALPAHFYALLCTPN